MELTNEAYSAINRYFSSLSHFGYKPYDQVNKLLILTFIEEILSGPMSQFITEEDYSLINNSLYCLYGTCMIPFPEYKRGVSTIVHKLPQEYRVTEENSIRALESKEQRAKS